MENKSATKGTGYKKEGCSKKKGADAIRRNKKGADAIRGGRTEGGRKQKGTDPKISPCKKYVVMITAA